MLSTAAERGIESCSHRSILATIVITAAPLPSYPFQLQFGRTAYGNAAGRLNRHQCIDADTIEMKQLNDVACLIDICVNRIGHVSERLFQSTDYSIAIVPKDAVGGAGIRFYKNLHHR